MVDIHQCILLYVGMRDELAISPVGDMAQMASTLEQIISVAAVVRTWSYCWGLDPGNTSTNDCEVRTVLETMTGLKTLPLCRACTEGLSSGMNDGRDIDKEGG